MTLRRKVIFEANCDSQALMVFKYFNHLHELSVTATAAAPTADRVGERAKSAGQTTITNFLLFLGVPHNLKTSVLKFKS